MSRNINIGGHKETFPDKYIKIVQAKKRVFSYPGNTALQIDFSDVIPSPYVASDVVAMSIDGYAVSADWNTRIFPMSYNSPTTSILQSVGATTQNYDICVKFFIAVKAADSY